MIKRICYINLYEIQRKFMLLSGLILRLCMIAAASSSFNSSFVVSSSSSSSVCFSISTFSFCSSVKHIKSIRFIFFSMHNVCCEFYFPREISKKKKKERKLIYPAFFVEQLLLLLLVSSSFPLRSASATTSHEYDVVVSQQTRRIAISAS